ncbi:MFS transporter [Mycolicibacterium goodii]|uniref:MFS transporter n=1 Tax=Mycolicibacterium goodii TaxID=134601 RepID=UPI001F039999|nr:MFS transporter [Mycolicibacterium goodii]ULN51117.1 MFS transporter [Mycolicibacterium goodii]
MPALLASAALGFTGFALLLPVAPMWAVRIGADNLGAGLVNTVLMACTVIAQLVTGRLIERAGARATLAIGLLLLGGPALLHVFAETQWAVLVLAALRGLGFGIVTVTGVDGVAGLFAQEHRGRAVGAYGLAIAAPQFILSPLAPWLAEEVSFGLVFALATAPVLAIPFALAFTRPVPTPPRSADGERFALTAGVVSPIIALVVITASGGAILTFAPQFGSAEVAFAALLALTGVTALARWLVGGLADRFGPGRFIQPLLYLGAVGLLIIAAGIARGALVGDTLIVAGASLVGVAYGALQSVTLVQGFAATGEHARSKVSVAWNVGFDGGTGIGALAVGGLATAGSFPMAFTVLAVACTAMGLTWYFTHRRSV